MNSISELLAETFLFGTNIVIALDCYHEAQAMDSILSDKQHGDLYKKAPHFFLTAHQAMLYRFNMEVAKMFEENGKVKNWFEYKNTIIRGNFLAKNSFSAFQTNFAKANASINAISKRRNKFLAHSDRDTWNNSKAVIEENPVDYQAVEALLYSMLEICNKIQMRYDEGGPVHLFSDGNSDDFVRLVGMRTKWDIESEELFKKFS